MTSAKTVAIPKHELVGLYRQALASGVSLDKIEEKVEALWTRSEVSKTFEAKDDTVRKTKLEKRIPSIVRYGALLVPLFFVGVGIFLVGSAVFPILMYYITTLPGLQATNLTTPIPRDQVLDVMPVVVAQNNIAQAATAQTADPIIIDTQLDYTNLSNWFGNALPSTLESQEEAKTFTLDIPSLKIANAEVTIGGTDLSKSLIQFPGTADPGELGSPVIFGHSVLRQFYNPSEKNPKRYTSIFSTIMTLKKGDEIFVTYAGVKYKYLVQDKLTVKPADTFILNQRYDSRQLKLVTCTPEGTYIDRGVVIAQLVPN
jgi:LPXTG-site transpeptidase (sortase) family protein